MQEMKEIKCPICQKVLCKAKGYTEIKCSRQGCKAIVRYDPATGSTSVVKEEKPVYSQKIQGRTTSSGMRFV